MTASERRRYILKLVRLQNAIERAEDAAAEAYEFDSEFDGGEFSGPAHQRALMRNIRSIALRFGFTDVEWADTAIQYMRCALRSSYAIRFGGFRAPLPD